MNESMTIKEIFLKVIIAYSDNATMPSIEYEPNQDTLRIAYITLYAKPDDVSMEDICRGMSQEVGDELMYAIGDYCAYGRGSLEERAVLLEYAGKYCTALYKDLMEGTYIRQ